MSNPNPETEQTSPQSEVGQPASNKHLLIVCLMFVVLIGLIMAGGHIKQLFMK